MKILVVLFTTYLAVVTCGDLPDYVPRCYRNDDDLENCLIDASEKIKPHLKNGFPQFKIPSLEPLILDNVDVSQEGSEYEYTANLFNFTFVGLTNYTFEKLRFNPDTLTLYGRVVCPPVYIEGKLRLDGKVVVVPVNSDGEFAAMMGPMVTNFTIRGKLEKRKNAEYFVPTKIRTTMTILDIDFSVFDLFNENRHLSELTRTLFNANSELVMSKSGPVFEQLSDSVVMRYLKKLTREVPYDKLLPIRK